MIVKVQTNHSNVVMKGFYFVGLHIAAIMYIWLTIKGIDTSKSK